MICSLIFVKNKYINHYSVTDKNLILYKFTQIYNFLMYSYIYEKIKR